VTSLLPPISQKAAQHQMTTAIRVNGEFRREHLGAVVRLVGELVDATSDPFTLKTTDGQAVSVHRRSQDSRLQSGWVEVTGKLQSDLSILEDFTVPFEGVIDCDTWNQMITLMHRHKEIFF
jgi:hypothetical protein